MKFGFLIATAGLIIASPATAQSLDPLTYLQICPAVSNPLDDWCGYQRARFTSELPMAYRGDYQSVRNVAYCLATGCDGAIKVDVREACAWRTIAYGLAPTGDEKILETSSMRAHCSTVPPGEVKAFLDAILMRVEEMTD